MTLPRWTRVRRLTRGRSVRGALALLLTGVAALAGACTDVTTDPAAPVSLQFDSLPAPSLVAGDTLRDANGVPTRLTAHAFNVDGDTIEDAPITFTVIPPDTFAASRAAVTVSPDGYVVAADTARASSATWRVVAQAGALQSRPTTRTAVAVVLRPDSLEAVAPTGPDTLPLIYNWPDSTSATGKRTAQVKARLLHDSLVAGVPAPSVGVGPYLVRFSISPDDTVTVLDSVRFLNGTRREITTVVATGSDGVATARVQAYPKAGQTIPDTIGVLASVHRRPAGDASAPVRNSPVRLLVPMRAVTGTTP